MHFCVLVAASTHERLTSPLSAMVGKRSIQGAETEIIERTWHLRRRHLVASQQPALECLPAGSQARNLNKYYPKYYPYINLVLLDSPPPRTLLTVFRTLCASWTVHDFCIAFELVACGRDFGICSWLALVRT